MYKIISFRYESVIQKNFARLRRAKFCLPPPITNPFLRPCITIAERVCFVFSLGWENLTKTLRGLNYDLSIDPLCIPFMHYAIMAY